MSEDVKLLTEQMRTTARELQQAEMWVTMTGAAGQREAERIVRLRDDLVRARAALEAASPPGVATATGSTSKATAAGGTLMGAGTTDLVATVSMRMERVATSMAHLFALRGTPLVTVRVENLRDTKARVSVRCHIEGYTGEVIESKELGARTETGSTWNVDLFPPFYPERVRTITELCAASLHIRVDDLDAKTELIQARSIALMPPTTAVLGYRDPSTGTVVDQRDLLAAWVTPNAPPILDLLRTAADFSKLKAMLGYQVGVNDVREHVRAIYMALNAAQIVYIDSRIAFGASAGQSIQRVRLPRESLATRSANCIDGTVLMASLLEATGIDPLIVIVPGHAYMGYRPDAKAPLTYEYVETTMIGTKSFEEASAVARQRTEMSTATGQIKHLDVRKLREAGVTPME